MTSSAAPPRRTAGRAAVVAVDLAALRGPTSGRVELPLTLFWQKDRSFDLREEAWLRWMYEIVLREAGTVEQLQTWLHGPTLIELWPRLYLPLHVRQAWARAHPVLRRRSGAGLLRHGRAA